MSTHELYIRRCIELARLGAGNVSPNPLVGAVLVHKNRIIGEGYHQEYGKAHAEVNAVASVKTEDRSLIPHSTMYVSLEPCCIFGRTPPCTDLIRRERIPRVVISYLDNTPGVQGKSLKILEDAGVEVITKVLHDQGEALFKIREVYNKEQRPYIILKYAVSRDHFFAPLEAKQFWISNKYSKRLVHKWRAEADAILIGTNTALTDNPSLTTRHYFGDSPTRVLLDRQLRVPDDYNIFQGPTPTLVFTEKEKSSGSNVEYIKHNFQENSIFELVKHLHSRKISSLIVEGGVQLIRNFMALNLYDEIRVLKGNSYLKEGKKAPQIATSPIKTVQIDDDELLYYHNER